MVWGLNGLFPSQENSYQYKGNVGFILSLLCKSLSSALFQLISDKTYFSFFSYLFDLQSSEWVLGNKTDKPENIN